MSISQLSRITGKYHRAFRRRYRILANRFGRRMTAIKTSVPIISFTFDDAPRTAFIAGGDILKAVGARATFYVSLGLLGSQTEVGIIASRDDLQRAVDEGHELGCHTFDHLGSWQTTTENFMLSVARNREALDRVLPGARFRTFAYPMSESRPGVKSRLEKYFMCCRGGIGQTPNVGMADLNLLKDYFLDARKNVNMDQIERLIDYNSSRQGWLIFVTHDVADDPSPYGCTPKFFGEVVGCAARSGALLLPVKEACEKIQTPNLERIG